MKAFCKKLQFKKTRKLKNSNNNVYSTNSELFKKKIFYNQFYLVHRNPMFLCFTRNKKSSCVCLLRLN